MLFLLGRLDSSIMRRFNENAAGAKRRAVHRNLIRRDDEQEIRLARRHHGAEDALAKAHIARDRAAALAHAVHVALLHVQAGAEGHIGQNVGGLQTPCPPSPAITTLVGLLLIAPLVLADRAGCQQAVPAGNHHGKLRLVQAALNQISEIFRLRVGSIT
jgi:hypothetical protein